jgi:ketosteroid isomerase-like protein
MEPTDPQADVLKTFDEIRRAMLANDAAVLSRHVADDYRGSDAGGRSHGREQYLAAYGPGGVTLETFDVSDLRTTAWTDTVLVTGVALIRGAYQDQRFEHRLRFLDVYRQRDGAWRLVASSATDVVEG